MKRRFWLIPLLCSLFLSCQTVPTVHMLSIRSTALGREHPLFTANQLSSPDPAFAYDRINQLFLENTRQAYRELIQYGNYMLESFRSDLRTASLANLMAWSSLFLVKNLSPDSPSFFSEYGQNLGMYNRAYYYAGQSAALDPSSHQIWQNRATKLISVVQEGFVNQSALLLYLRTRKDLLVLMPAKRSFAYGLDAFKTLKNLRDRYPRWLPALVASEIHLTSAFLRSQ